MLQQRRDLMDEIERVLFVLNSMNIFYIDREELSP